ncbi:MAG: N-acetylglucosamine-6-phosphate deacetylase [Paracoccaceae bacterium]
MNQTVRAFVGADIHDGSSLQSGSALIVEVNGTARIVDPTTLPHDCEIQSLNGGIISPGFIDLQVNGGGGVMFNDDQSVAALRQMAKAHATTGTAAILPTLITDTPERTSAALDAVEQAIAQNVPGIIGIHLEGPHLSRAKKGAHDADLIRPMSDADLNQLLEAAQRLPNVMVTVAPESVDNEKIRQMNAAGITISLGHTDADFETCLAAFDAGARCVTHLFNTMSQMTARAPGLVGATLARKDIYAGLIADGIHVHPAMMRLALDAEGENQQIFLVTDAMATVGSDLEEFQLNGRRVLRWDNRLTLSDGTLAGADLEISYALDVLAHQANQELASSLARTTSIPRKLLRNAGKWGGLSAGLGTLLYFDAKRNCQHLVNAGS